MGDVVEHHITRFALREEKVGPENFELLKVLGTGAYGKVFLVRKNGGFDHGKLFAMKVLKKGTILQKQKTTEYTLTERQVLERVRQSPFLVTLHYAFQTDAKLHLILEYVNGGEMFTHLNQRERFTEDEARLYIAEVTLALEHLHSLGIIYRDIKLENILLDATGHIVLTDFGLSKGFAYDSLDKRTYSFCGTIEYMAPEVLRGGKTGHDMAVDWWSVGVLLYELCTGASPFTIDNETNSQSDITRRILNNSPPLPHHFSPQLRSLIWGLLQKDPKVRIGCGTREAAEVKEHPFFQELNWDDVLHKRIQAPFKPRVRDEMDVGNFAEEFTTMAPVDSPAFPPQSAKRFAQIFRGFSFVAPSVLFNAEIFADSAAELCGTKSASKPINNLIQNLHVKNSPFLRNYTLNKKVIGRGSFSTVCSCIHKETGAEYAVKIVSNRNHPQREVQILRMCQGHPNIVKLVDVQKDELHTYIIMEHVRGGELLDRIREKKIFSEAEAVRIMRQLISALSFLHSRCIVHRDLKPENILFTDNSDDADVKLVDFGFARVFSDHQPLKTPCFTLTYAAPEVLRNVQHHNTPTNSAAVFNNEYGDSCDVWSLGVILYIMLSGRVPFQGSQTDGTMMAVIKQIKGGSFNLSGEEWQSVSHSARELIKGLLTVDAAKRLSLTQVKNAEWIMSADVPHTPLMTPGYLKDQKVASTVKHAVNTTFDAYRTEFSLADVSEAPIAKRRKLKKDSSKDGSSSTEGEATTPQPVITLSAISAVLSDIPPAEASPSKHWTPGAPSSHQFNGFDFPSSPVHKSRNKDKSKP